MVRVHPDWRGFMICRQNEAESDDCGRLSESVRERWRRNASSLLWWVRITWVFHDKSKSVRSERGQGGSVAVNTDNLSQQRPLAALYPNLHRKQEMTWRYFLPSSLLVLFCTYLLSQSVLPVIYSLLFFRIRLWSPFFLLCLLLFYFLFEVFTSFPAA